MTDLRLLSQVWAYANLGCDPGPLLDAVAHNFETRMREFTPQNVSNILWAYAKLGGPCFQLAAASGTTL